MKIKVRYIIIVNTMSDSNHFLPVFLASGVAVLGCAAAYYFSDTDSSSKRRKQYPIRTTDFDDELELELDQVKRRKKRYSKMSGGDQDDDDEDDQEEEEDEQEDEDDQEDEEEEEEDEEEDEREEEEDDDDDEDIGDGYLVKKFRKNKVKKGRNQKSANLGRR